MVLSLFLGTVQLVISSHAGQVARRPNILFLMSDQHRWDAMGANVRTPNLDSLAKTGVKFNAHYASVPSCPGARASIVSGLSPFRHGMVGFGKVPPQYQHDMPREVANLGYKTIAIGKNHFGWNNTEDRGVNHGYQVLEIYDGAINIVDDYAKWFHQERPGENQMKTGGLSYNSFEGAVYEFDEYLHPTAWTGNRSVAMIQKLAQTPDEPWLLKVSFHRPHPPYDPPQRLFDETPVPTDMPARSVDGWDAKFKECAMGGGYPWCGELAQDVLDNGRRAYRASTSFVDEQIGVVLKALEDAGLADNTFILFSSDHGDMQNDHYLRLKQFAYEGSAHIPMILRWPPSMDADIAVERGHEVNDVTELRDIYPTFLSVAGGWTDEWEELVDGRPLTWLLQESRPKPWRKWIDLQHNDGFAAEHISWNAITDGKVKYIYHAKTGAVQFFNLTADRAETKDLAGDPAYAESLALWRARMVSDFEAEQRGAEWVRNGDLTIRPGNCLYTLNFPLGPKCPQGVHTNSLLARNTTVIRGARRHIPIPSDTDLTFDMSFN